MQDINELRKVMGTLPTQEVPLETKFVRGVEGINVELIDYNVNPYKAMYVLATSCWGSKINKWAETSPEHRFLVVKAVLSGNALPLALETPSFTFTIEGISRAGFDQLARTRIGAVFSAKGMRDNNWKNASIRIPTALWPTKEEFLLYESRKVRPEWPEEVEAKMFDKVDRFYSILDSMNRVKRTYSDIVDSGAGSWQAARTVLPLYVVYGFSSCYNLASLMGVCRNRMKFCEMEDVVATAWLMQRAVAKQFPLIGNYLRPGCDFGKKCQYHKSYSLSETFGCLFKECGRNPCPDSDGYAEFNQTCTNYKDIEEQLGFELMRPEDWIDYTWDILPESDKKLFMEA